MTATTAEVLTLVPSAGQPVMLTPDEARSLASALKSAASWARSNRRLP